MSRVTVLVLASLVAAAVQTSTAQTFPEPGTGVFTWRRVGDRPLDAESFAFAPDGRLYTGRDTIFVLDPPDAGAPRGRWRALGYHGGINEALMALHGDTLFAGRSSTIRRSVNGGATWSVVNGGVGGEVGGPHAPDGFFALPPGHPDAGRLLAGGVILYSDDRGASWADADQDIPTNSQSSARTFAALPSGRVFAGTGGGVLGSDDGGASYLRTPLWGPFGIDALATLATPGSAQTGAPACGLAEPALCDGAVAIGIDATASDVRAWWTNDGGRSWSEPVPLPEPVDGAAAAYVVGVVALEPGTDGLGRAITVLGRGVIYKTDDGGQTWEVIGRLPIQLGGASHYPHLVRLGPDGHLWVTTTINGPSRQWMWRSAEPAEAAFIVAGEPPVRGPSRDVSVTVRPNPAARRAEVVVRLTAPARLRVVVVDGRGREMSAVWSGEAGAGERVFSVDASRWPAGTYIVRAVADEHVASVRLVVTR